MTVIAHQLITAEIDYMLSLIRPIQAMYGEAGGIATAHFGGAVALTMHENADPLFNRVLGFCDGELPLLDDILKWYADRHAACRFDILSGVVSPPLLERLEEWGFFFHPVEMFLSTSPKPSFSRVEDGLEVRKLGQGEFDEFSSTFLAVYPQPPAAEEAMRTCLKAQYGQPEWHCYLACVAGTVAAFGAMYVHNGTAALISAATLPQFRRRGCQTALLARRLADAAEIGCTLAWSHAACDSTSQRNMERQGMRPEAIKYRYERSVNYPSDVTVCLLPPPAVGPIGP